MPARAAASLQSEARLSRTLSALSDSTRRAIVGRLSKGSATAGELAQPFSIGLPTISKHLRTLEGAGLVQRERQAQWHVFRLQAQPLAEVDEWLRAYEGFWLGTLDSLHGYVKEIGGGHRSTSAPARRAAKPAKAPERRRGSKA